MIIIISGVAVIIFVAILCITCIGSNDYTYQRNIHGNTEIMGNVVYCSCGFSYNLRNHDSCPNCSRRAYEWIFGKNINICNQYKVII